MPVSVARAGPDTYHVIGQVNSSLGVPVPSAGVSVTDVIAGGAATIYSDEFLQTPLSQPYFADRTGRFEFFVSRGRYTFAYSGADRFASTEELVVIGPGAGGGGLTAAAIVLESATAPAVGPAGTLWVETTPTGSVYRSNGTSWVERWRTKASADAAYEPLMSSGTIAARPTAATFGKGYYFATDEGKLYHSNSTAWTLVAITVGGAGMATDTLWDAKGDLAVATGADTASKLPAGADGQVLQVDSSQATGVKWYNRSRSVTDTNSDVTVVNSVAETTLATLAVPTTVAVGDVLPFTIVGDIMNNSGSIVTYNFRLKLGATQVLVTGTTNHASGANRRQLWVDGFILVVAVATDSRVGAEILVSAMSSNPWPNGAVNLSTAGSGVAVEDLSAGKNLTFTVQMGTADANADCRIHEALLEISKR